MPASDAPDISSNDAPAKRSLPQRIGLVSGLILFIGVLSARDIPGVSSWAADQLNLPVEHIDVVEANRGAQGTLAVTLLMVTWWLTEAVPIPVTALLPGVMLPLLHVTGIDHGQLLPFTNNVAFVGYADPVIYLFLAGFLLAGAMRKVGLDRRMTLAALCWRPVTRSSGTILLGIMSVTAFMSMWISNTATAAMMLPIALGVLRELDEPPGKSRFGCALMLGVAWSASIGGIATIIGSPPNGIAVGILRAQGIADIDFVQWMTWALPVSLLGVIAAWAMLMAIFRPRVNGMVHAHRGPGDEGYSDSESGMPRSVIGNFRVQRDALGKWSADERFTLAVFILVVTLWITQPFWENLLPAAVHDRVSRLRVHELGLLCALLLFIVPLDWRHWRPVLNWRDTKFVDWGTLILFGGGISLSNAMFKTGLTDWLATGFVDHLPAASPWICLTLIVLMVDYLTEITSNTAVTTMMTPILIVLAPQMGLSPTVVCVAAAMASSLAFMLPVATPPNALVFATGYFTVAQMARAGFLMNLVGCGVLILCLYVVRGGALQVIVP